MRSKERKAIKEPFTCEGSVSDPVNVHHGFVVSVSVDCSLLTGAVAVPGKHENDN